MEHERKPNRLLAHKRIERHLTQARLAETLEVSLDTVRNWERGRSSPSLVMRARLCEFFSATHYSGTCRRTEGGNAMASPQKKRSYTGVFAIVLRPAPEQQSSRTQLSQDGCCTHGMRTP